MVVRVLTQFQISMMHGLPWFKNTYYENVHKFYKLFVPHTQNHWQVKCLTVCSKTLMVGF